MFLLDLKLPCTNTESECVTVPMDLYEQACVSDSKKGLEVRITLYNIYFYATKR